MTESKKHKLAMIIRIILTLFLLTLSSAIFLSYSGIAGTKGTIPSKFKTAIHECDTSDLKLIDGGIVDLNKYFDQVESNLEPFLDDLFSLTSKAQMLWYMVKDLKWELPEDISPALMMVALIPHREGESLEAFLENKFDTHFGGSENLEQALKSTVSSIGFELRQNNSQMEMELGKLLAEDINGLNQEGKSAVQCMQQLRSSIRKLSGTMVSETAGMQIGVELIGVASDIWLAPVIGGFLAEAAGMAEGLCTSVTSFGVGFIIAVGIDLVANEVARNSLKPKIEEALAQWRRETINTFRAKMMDKLTDMHAARRQLIAEVLNDYEYSHTLVAGGK